VRVEGVYEVDARVEEGMYAADEVDEDV